MNQKCTILPALLFATMLLATMHQVFSGVECQILDRIFNNNNNNDNGNEITDGKDLLSDQRSGVNPLVSKIMGVLNVNLPGIYNMTKNGNSMGLNVLSGLVRVDRGKEAERSGLQGSRPLSVRVFGIPVYERGARTSGGGGGGIPSIFNTRNQDKPGAASTPGSTLEDEELPIET